MEKEKKKYVKPLMRVAEWDFNEAVCTDQTLWRSYCLNIDNSGRQTRLDLVENSYDRDIEWNRFNGSR